VHQVPPQTYLNLDKGVTDASFNTLAQVRDYSLTDICDYFYTQDFGRGTIIMLMNLEAWNGMSPADKKIMEDSWRDASKVSSQGSMKDLEAGRKVTLEAGKKIINPTLAENELWAQAAEVASFKKWKEDAIALGADRQVTENVLAEWKKIRKKYLK